MRGRIHVLAAIMILGGVTQARAQGSIFALRGLGWESRPVSARAAGTAGAMGMFDPEMNTNPAAFTRWRSTAAWGVAAPTTRSFTTPNASGDQQTMRFPLFGFAAPLPPRAVIGVTIADYLDRTWTLQTTDSMLLRGTMEKFTDAGRSIGGVSDLAVGGGYRLTPTLSLGAAYHYYLGSTRLTAQRLFTNLDYLQILEQSQTDFHGMGLQVGALWSLPKVDLAASARLNGSLSTYNSTGSSARTQLPAELSFGARWQAVPGIFVGANAQYDGWARASGGLASTQAVARNVWAFAVGAEVQSVSLASLHTPLRLGYRTRTLPFTTTGFTITEHAVAGGFGLNLAQDRTTIDVGLEGGSRSAGPERETFKSIFVGLTVRP